MDATDAERLDPATHADAFLPADDGRGWSRSSATGQGTFPLLRQRSVATRAAVDEAASLRPDAAPLLEWWLEAWTRVQSSLDRPLDASSNESAASTRVAEAERLAAVFRDREDPVASLSEREVEEAAEALLRSEEFRAVGDEDRDWRLHVVEDAWTLRRVVDAGLPGRVGLVVLGTAMVYEGRDPDGYPLLVRASGLPKERAAEARRALDAVGDGAVPYWRMPGFLAAAGRRMGVAAGRASAALRLLAMARSGARKAFVKGLALKSGTWTVDLAGVATAAAALGRLAEAMGTSAWPAGGLLVQEHLPFLREQRFFVVGGRVVASVCSDRGLCHLDRRPGRRLDDRLALVRSPAAPGGFDRGSGGHVVDRREAAAFARFARSLAAALRRDGMTDYVVDVGATSRGVAAVELNSAFFSGPYCLDRGLQVRAFGPRPAPRPATDLLLSMRRYLAVASPDGVDDLADGFADVLSGPARGEAAAGAPAKLPRFDRTHPLDLAAAAVLPSARPLLVVPFSMTLGRADVYGKMLFMLTFGAVMPVAAWARDGRISAAPVPYAAGGSDDPVLDSLVRGRVRENEGDGSAAWLLFDDGRMTCRASIERTGRRRSRLEVVMDEGSRRLAHGEASFGGVKGFSMSGTIGRHGMVRETGPLATSADVADILVRVLDAAKAEEGTAAPAGERRFGWSPAGWRALAAADGK